MKNPRYKKITSSTIAAIFGCNPYQTELEAQLAILNPDGDEKHSAEITRGNVLEKTVADWCGEKLGVTWAKASRKHHPHYPNFFSDSADFVSDDGRFLCEAKTASGRVADQWGDEGTDDIPRHYLIQCHWHLMHWPDAMRCYVPVLIGGFEFEFRLYVVERDEELETDMLKYALDWHQKHIVEMQPCAATAGDTDAIKRMFPSRRDREKDLVRNDDPLIGKLARQYKLLDEEIKKLTDEKDGIKNRLCQIVGDAPGIIGDWGKCTWGDRKGQISWGKLVEENFNHLVTDEMRERYQSHYRVFAIKEAKKQ